MIGSAFDPRTHNQPLEDYVQDIHHDAAIHDKNIQDHIEAVRSGFHLHPPPRSISPERFPFAAEMQMAHPVQMQMPPPVQTQMALPVPMQMPRPSQSPPPQQVACFDTVYPPGLTYTVYRRFQVSCPRMKMLTLSSTLRTCPTASKVKAPLL